MNHEQKKLPIGIETFSKIRTENYYYVDKTGFIRELVKTRGDVNLFTRPRRFGKSLNMDMLRSFFEIGTDAALFEGLEIMKDKELCEDFMGKFPVLSISLKDCAGSTMSEALDMLGMIVNEEALRMQQLMDSPRLTRYDKIQLERLLEGNFEKISYLTGSLRVLSRLLFQHYGRKVIILIDEYDVPLDKSYQNGYYSEMAEVIRSLFSQALKTNNNLQFAVLTGCLRIARESIFTGLNHFKVRTISDMDYAEYFGFTDHEVKEMLAYYDLEEAFEDMKEWYDGYHFGCEDVYCPWDVVNQCDKLRVCKNAPMESHWGNSSSNVIVRDIIEHATATARDEIEALISGECIEKKLMPELTYADLDSEDDETRQTYLWSILFSTGYLTETGRAENGAYKLVIPNREVREIYEKKISSWFKQRVKSNRNRLHEFCNAVRLGEAEKIQQMFDGFMADSISIRDTFVKKEMKENFYHGMLLGLLQAESTWIVKSNVESGVGYTDILVELRTEKIGCIIEVKYAEGGHYGTACSEAMRQIADNGYVVKLRQEGMRVIHSYGIACYKKQCKVVHKKWTDDISEKQV